MAGAPGQAEPPLVLIVDDEEGIAVLREAGFRTMAAVTVKRRSPWPKTGPT